MDIILLSDQDDIWNSEKLRIMSDAMLKINADLVFHDVSLVDLALHPVYPSFWKFMSFNPKLFEGRDYFQLLKGNVVQGSACAFKRTLFEKSYPFPQRQFMMSGLL